MSAVEIADAVRRLLTESGAQGWTVDVADDDGWTIALVHPASHGLVLGTGTRDVAVAIDRAQRWLMNTDEIQIASAAPVLTHPDLVME